jgi:hypothetical protein
MAFLKSTFVGIVTFLLATIAYVFIATAVFLRRHPIPPGEEVGFDLRSLIANPLYWLIAIAAFALGFYWQFRRTKEGTTVSRYRNHGNGNA